MDCFKVSAFTIYDCSFVSWLPQVGIFSDDGNWSATVSADRGSKSTITHLGTCFPAPVSEKNLSAFRDQHGSSTGISSVSLVQGKQVNMGKAEVKSHGFLQIFP